MGENVNIKESSMVWSNWFLIIIFLKKRCLNNFISLLINQTSPLQMVLYHLKSLLFIFVIGESRISDQYRYELYKCVPLLLWFIQSISQDYYLLFITCISTLDEIVLYYLHLWMTNTLNLVEDSQNISSLPKAFFFFCPHQDLHL